MEGRMQPQQASPGSNHIRLTFNLPGEPGLYLDVYRLSLSCFLDNTIRRSMLKSISCPESQSSPD
jgi:hypothetical protein